MTGRAAATQGGLAAIGLLAALVTSQRQPEHAPGSVTVIDATKMDVTHVHYTDEHNAVDFERGPGDKDVPVWILGSSLYGAQLAAMLGLPYAFASHFAPAELDQALDIYRERFEPSEQLAKPHAMVGVNIIAADTDREAKRLATTQQMSFTNMFRGKRGLSQPPIDDIESYWSSVEKAQAMQMLARSIVGSPDTIRAGLTALLAETGADELMIVSDVYDHGARLHSFELIAAANAANAGASAMDAVA